MPSNKARESLLSLFDPLANPQTPERNTSSPDSSSDKENDGPGEVTVFFNRIYTKPPQAAAPTPKGKLIDYGDVFVNDSDGDRSMDCDAAENQPPDPDTEMRDVFAEPEGPFLREKRQPLADIKLEPVRRLTAFAETEELAWNEDEENVSSHIVTAAPAGDPLADVINSINLSAMTISDDVDSSGETATPASGMFPEISVSLPEVEIAPPTPTESMSPITSPVSQTGIISNLMTTPNTSMTSRPNHLTTSSADPRRTSVDLQSSFRLQLGSPDMSFDLLNDKISFLGQDGSFWGMGEDDTLDFRKEEAKMLAIAEEYERPISEETIPAPNPIRRTPPKSASASPQVNNFKLTPPNDSPVPTRKPVFSLPPRAPSAETIVPKALETIPASDTADVSASSSAAVNAAGKKSTSAEKAVPVVPALRIVKKSWKIHDRTSSISSSSTVASGSSRRSSVTSASSSRSTSRSGAISPDTAPGVQTQETMPKKATVVPKPAIRGVQRPPPGAMLPPSNVTSAAGGVLNRLRPAASQSALRAGAGSSSTRSSSTTTSSIAAKLSGVQRPTTVVSQAASAKPSGIATGIRPPSRVPTSSSTSRLTSGLPQPSSRLLAATASRITPPNSAGLGNGKGTAGRSAGATLRRVP